MDEILEHITEIILIDDLILMTEDELSDKSNYISKFLQEIKIKIQEHNNITYVFQKWNPHELSGMSLSSGTKIMKNHDSISIIKTFNGKSSMMSLIESDLYNLIWNKALKQLKNKTK